MPEILVTSKVMNDNTKVIAIFPVTFADPGRRPTRLFIKIKKNNVNK